jgi:hypothetical protein
MADERKNEEPKSNPELKNVEAGSDADATPTPSVDAETLKKGNAPGKPAPLELGSEQKDDNIDDKGNKAGGGKQDQPT